MNVTVFVPAYRRPGALVWSLASVLLQRFDGMDLGRARIIVLNNDRDRAPVETALATALREVGAGPWETEIVHRDPPMDPVLSWYGGIRDKAAPGDMVFLHGDDDLLLADSLRVRCQILADSGADLLLTKCFAQVVFDGPEARAAVMLHDERIPRACPEPWVRADIAALADQGMAFIGNHAYRITDHFWAGHAQTLEAMDTLPLGSPQQLAMLPYFLPLGVMRAGTVAVSNALTSVRGQSLHELVGQPFGQRMWNPGVLYAATVALLDSGRFGPPAELAALRAAIWAEFASWYSPSVSRRTTRRELQDLGMASLRQFGLRDLPKLLRGVGNVTKGFLGLQCFRLRMRRWDRAYTRRAMLDVLSAGSVPDLSEGARGIHARAF